MRRITFAGLLAVIFVFDSSVSAGIQLPQCNASFSQLLSSTHFKHYPASVDRRGKRLVLPDVRSGEAHRFRTAIRDEAKEGLDFAGHYKIARIGCGAGTVCPAIVDLHSGGVFFPSQIGSVGALLVDAGDESFDTLNYRKDSRLLIAIGIVNEEDRRKGVSYFLWNSNKLILLRFIPTSQLCGKPKQ